MKKIAINILLIAFIGLSVFGIFAMNEGNMHGQGCLAEMARNFNCPSDGVLALINFHAEAFKGFSNYSVNLILAVLLAFFAAMLLYAHYLRNFYDKSQVSQNYEKTSRNIFDIPVPVRLDSIGWLSLHENSPSF